MPAFNAYLTKENLRRLKLEPSMSGLINKLLEKYFAEYGTREIKPDIQESVKHEEDPYYPFETKDHRR